MFHLALVAALADAAIRAAGEYRTKTVALAGGCFHNRVLKRRLTDRLQAAGLTVLRPRTVDCGDAGIALGQAWIAACASSRWRTAIPSAPAAASNQRPALVVSVQFNRRSRTLRTMRAASSPITGPKRVSISSARPSPWSAAAAMRHGSRAATSPPGSAIGAR